MSAFAANSRHIARGIAEAYGRAARVVYPPVDVARFEAAGREAAPGARFVTVSRLVRAQVLTIKEREHVEAARTLGATSPRIVRVHIMPHVMAPVIIAIAFGVPGAIMLEASLSFLGIGVNPPTPSWGLMISSGITNMRSHPYMLISPALALGVTLLAFTFLGDGLRDAMDPHMKR